MSASEGFLIRESLSMHESRRGVIKVGKLDASERRHQAASHFTASLLNTKANRILPTRSSWANIDADVLSVLRIHASS